jgi:hypothetical protein
MAFCVSVPISGGGHAIVRLSGKRTAPCDYCRRPHTNLCDAIVGDHTCNAKLCDKHTIQSGRQDFCPAHKELA